MNWDLMFKQKPLIFFGRAVDSELKEDILQTVYPGLHPANCDIGNFGDGEIYVRDRENVRDKHIFIVQPTNPPGDNIVELGIMIDCLRRASAKEITVINPYTGYARQDRKSRPRESIAARWATDLISNSGAHRVVSVDLHAGQIQGFFNCLADSLSAIPIFAQYAKTIQHSNPKQKSIIVAPDAGGGERAKRLSIYLNCDYLVASKERNHDHKDDVEQIQMNGKNIQDKIVFILDDITSTLSTLALTAQAAKQYSPKKIIVFVTHGLFSDGATERLNSSPIDVLLTTNSTNIPRRIQYKSDKIKIASLGPTLGRAISNLYCHKSISAIFDQKLQLKIY